MRVLKGYRQLSKFGESKYLRLRVLASKRDVIRIGGRRRVEVTIAPCTKCAEMTANRGRVCVRCLNRSAVLA